MTHPSVRCSCRAVLVLIVIGLFSGCATTGGSGDPRDPYEGFNRSVTDFNDYMNEQFFEPVGETYNDITPDFLDRGITNFFSNLDDVSVIVNDLLQFKLGQAVSDIARVVFNTTIGIGGFFDVSTVMGLPRHNEDFGQTMAVWGAGSGPYLVIPFFGPSTVRDVAGFGVDTALFSPLMYVIDDRITRTGLMTLAVIDFKADLLGTEQLIKEAALDPYEFTKDAFFQRRNNQIHDRGMTEYPFEDDLYFEEDMDEL